jgi:hypothetical protein
MVRDGHRFAGSTTREIGEVSRRARVTVTAKRPQLGAFVKEDASSHGAVT